MPRALSVYKSDSGERKFVSVLFSDLSESSLVINKLDPEEVKDLMGRIFGEITRIVFKYGGFIEKFVGDAVMAIFGAEQSHEDDPIRAIRAAREIHELVPGIHPEIQTRIKQTLSMHTGISTGLVVIGAFDQTTGTHGFIGNTINMASRLCSMADANAILVDTDTYIRSGGYYHFKIQEFDGPVNNVHIDRAYCVLSTKSLPRKTYRFQGLRAELIGREGEMKSLVVAVENLKKGNSGIFSVRGDAGTGKSRLLEEFRESSVLKDIQWLEGHAYSYSQNTPYALLIDLLNRFFKITEDDPPEQVRKNIKESIEGLIDDSQEVIRYINRLYTYKKTEAPDMDPEFWQSHIKTAVLTIFTHITRGGPTVFCLEDLHWADPSSLFLLHFILAKFNFPGLFICIYRPVFDLFSSQQINLNEKKKIHHRIDLRDFPPRETEKMVISLLKTENIPRNLKEYVRKSVGRNPFYIEEAVNSLIEAGYLYRENRQWELIRLIDETIMPATVQGVISARLDRLGPDTKLLAQEASVIGRTFTYTILDQVTSVKGPVSRHLNELERVGLIRIRALDKDTEYVFKHVLTQEAIYKGLLKKERKKIHKRIADVLINMHKDRLSEYFETLAFHFKQSGAEGETVEYLIKSGEKSLNRYALGAADQYYKEAYDLLSGIMEDRQDMKEQLIYLIQSWAMVLHHRGDFKEMEMLFRKHQGLAESLGDNEKLGEFYMWLGQALHLRFQTEESFHYLSKSLELGEKYNEIRVIGWASAYLPSVCTFLGLYDKVNRYADTALKICDLLDSEYYLYIQTMASIGYACWANGERRKAYDTGHAILKFGEEKSNTRGVAIGYLNIGHSYLISGDNDSALRYYQKSIDVSMDPFHLKLSETMLGICHLLEGRLKEALVIFQDILTFSQDYGLEILGITGKMYMGAALIPSGRMKKGLNFIQEARQYFHQKRVKYFVTLSSFILGKIYAEMARRKVKISLWVMLRNALFLVLHVPTAHRKAETYLVEAIKSSRAINANGLLGQAQLDLGLLYQAQGRRDEAIKALTMARETFERCQATEFFKQSEEALESV